MSDSISSDNKRKICPECGKKYAETDNFCSKHSELVKLVYEKDLVKICPVCQRKFTKEDNFCVFHEDRPIKLCYIKDLVKICKGCGSKYPEDYNFCIKCEWDEPLVKFADPKPHIDEIKELKFNPNKKYNFKKHVNCFYELDELLCDENIKKLEEFNFTQGDYDQIISNIIITYKKILNYFIKVYEIDFENLHILDKLLLFSKSFVKTEYKSVDGKNAGYYRFNNIYIDVRMEPANEIATIIHELTHFLLSEILEQCLSTILNTDKTDIIEAFICYMLYDDIFNNLIDEYCAYSVEGKFAILGYVDCGSYELILQQLLNDEYNQEDVIAANAIGNTFASHIYSIISTFIDDELRYDIYKEFNKLTCEKNYTWVKYETKDILQWDDFKYILKEIFLESIDYIKNNLIDIKKVSKYHENFKKSNMM